MATKLPPRPTPLAPTVRRFNADGTATREQIDFDAKMDRYLAALAAAAGAN